MLNISRGQQVMIWLTVVVGLFFALPNGFYERVEGHNDAIKLGQEDTSWPSFLPNGLVNLGLDLRGGAHLLAEVHVEDVHEARMEALWPEVRNALAEQRDTVGFVERIENGATDELRVRISNAEGGAQALEIVRGLAVPIQTLTGLGSTDIVASLNGQVITVRLSEDEMAALNERTMQQSLEIIRRRIDEVGTREPTIQRQGSDRILVQVPGVGSAQEVKDIIGTTAQLNFQPVISRIGDPTQAPGSGNEILPDVEDDNIYYILERNPVVTGEELVDAQPDFDQNGSPAVSFRFNVSGARKFGDYTLENIGSPFAIVLDDEVISAPTIQSHIAGGSGIITGNFTVEESTSLAVLLRAGALPAELTFLEERTIGPELGQDSIDAGTIACIVAFALVLAYMFISYGRFGFFANIALILNIGLLFGLLSMIGITLTLPGIAGIVLTIGMAVDANVIVFERIREELKTAKGPARAIELGYEKAMSSIVDANITTFITAVILLVMGSGPVQGFAWTLMFGIMTSVFSALFVTRAIIAIWFSRTRPKEIMGKRRFRLVGENTSYDFFSRARLWLGISGIAVIVAFGSFLFQGLNFGVDFQGGTSIRTQAETPVDPAAYRDALVPLDLGDFTITEVRDPTFDDDQHVAMIRVQAQEGQESITNDTIDAIKVALQDVEPTIDFTSTESVGPKVSGELIKSAAIAVAMAVAAILFYIWLRFEWQFALGAVMALVHDVLLTIGIFAIFQIKFDLAIIAALLTIVGYSINDTVIVFDRVRENLRKYKKKDLKDVLNISINETLSRTLMTSVTTMLALIALFVLGGDVIRGFVFAMMWGVFIGTYSSIFVATATLLQLGVKRDWSKPDNTAGNQFANVDA